MSPNTSYNIHCKNITLKKKDDIDPILAIAIKCREQILICSFQNFKFQLEYEEAKFAGLNTPRPNKEMRIDPLMNERRLETTPGKNKMPFS